MGKINCVGLFILFINPFIRMTIANGCINFCYELKLYLLKAKNIS
jgi:hypothetical protein